MMQKRDGRAAAEASTPMSLLLRLSEGRDDDWRTFYGIYAQMVLQLARRRHGLDAAVAEDVVAVVMARLAHMLAEGFQVDHQRGRFRAVVATLTAHAVSDLYRRTRSQGPTGVSLHDADGQLAHVAESPEPGAADELAALERSARVQHCLDRLRADATVRRRDWIAFERYALNDEPADAVARELELTAPRVYAIKHRMLQRIRTLLAQLECELGEV